ncbi:TetR/AcrR family transcriptional regulator [Lactococcus nasutitermitis]|uniref:TetR/AcrR family transcriptional regulator n=1 Tax=Lactococcus nasutitermitis TaxID=1652957 RepID=A0ABV9JC30_9LACT|nr:TetR/AcrR family transcriptional regulator [Lactococcus nasutitermitis]
MSERKRGEELQQAIFVATIEILENEGFLAVNFQKVAKKAQTSRGVLYKYWENAESLIYAAGRDYLQSHSKNRKPAIEQKFNRGNLRADLLDMLGFLRDNVDYLPKNFLEFIFFEDTQGQHLMDNRTHNLVLMERILTRAEERGEVRLDISESAKLLPFELLRQRMMVEGVRQSDAQLESVVDEILLPLYRVCSK